MDRQATLTDAITDALNHPLIDMSHSAFATRKPSREEMARMVPNVEQAIIAWAVQPAVPGRRGRFLRFEFARRDAWVGVFWKRKVAYYGSIEALSASTRSDQSWAHRRLDVWVCFLPMLPLHFASEWCPTPEVCKGRNCLGSAYDHEAEAVVAALSAP